jgi:hypothetical protein
MAQHIPRRNVIASATNHVSWIDELGFCVCDLIPYLKFLDKGNEVDLKCSPELEQAVSNISRQAAILQGRIGYTTGPPIPLDQLQKIFCVPCVVRSTQVIPMVLSGITGYSEPNSITFRYRYCIHEAQPLSSVLAEIQQSLEKEPNQEGTTNEIKRETAALIQEIDHLIARLDPVDLGRFKLIYYDRYHQIHYRNGHIVLVRGPIVGRNANHCNPIYVGLTISGKTRGERLMVQPHHCNQPEQLWTTEGFPISGGLCMGNPGQYSELSKSKFTDAEAVVQWLDAAVIVATGSSLFHRDQRDQKLKEMQQRQMSLERRQGKDEQRKNICSLDESRGDGTMLPDG